MSRLNSLSASAIKAMFSSETDEQLIMLLTIYDPVLTTGEPLRVADGFTGRLTNLTTDDEVVYGVHSRTKDYLFLPMSISLPSEQDTGVGQCTITIDYVIPDAIEVIRSHLTGPTKVLIELVLASSPDTVEVSYPGFFITNVSYNAQSIVFTLNMISYNTEPFPCFNFTPAYFPGLF